MSVGPDTVELDGYELTLDQVARTAVGPGTQCMITEDARGRMAASVLSRDRLIASGAALYGITTGFGDSSDRQISQAKVEMLQRNLLRFLRAGVGPYAPEEVVRGTMVIRANCAARGNSAIRVEVIELLLALLRQEILPQIPERGSVGASGDLAPLSYLAAALTGEGTVRHQGQVMSAETALCAAGLAPVTLQAKEGLALVNGTSFMVAYAVMAHTRAQRLAEVAELCTALTTECRLGGAGPFEHFLHLHKPHPGQQETAHRIARLMAGSSLGSAPGSTVTDPTAAEQGSVDLERHLQDPYSIRCAPHVIGVLRDTLTWTADWLTTEINSSNDNPLFDANTDTVHNGGNFYGGHVAHAAQAVGTAAAGVADLLDRQLQIIVDDQYSQGLPPNLITRVPPDNPDSGLHHGFKGAQITASALTAEALHLTNPISAYSRSTEAHNQDVVSMGTIAARKMNVIVDLAINTAAVHLTALAQAADLRGPQHLASATRAAHEILRSHIPPTDRDRPLDEDFACIASLIRSGALGVCPSD